VQQENIKSVPGRLPSEPLERYLFFQENSWAFLTHCVYTLDQVDRKTPVKLLPDRQYAEMYAKIWQKYPLIAVPKTRRMTMSWYTIGLFVWDTLFHSGRFNAFVSKKEDDADELVKRAKFIIEHIPQDMIPRELIPKAVQKFNWLEFPEINSKIQGFPQGADQLRQFTFSGIFGDESAFWEQAQEFYAASFPTIDGGGRMTLVSSPAPGFFKKICFDAIDRIGEVNVDEFHPEFSRPMEGVRIWKNKKNRFLIFELHYTADPLKRDPSYKESIKNSMPLMEYLREYELQWDTFSGYPVYPEFSRLHLLEEEPTPQAGLPMLIGFDFGLTPAAVIGQLQEDTLVIFEEIVEINMGAVRFAPKVAQHIRLKYPSFSDLGKNWRCFIDPAGLNRSETDESTCAQVLGETGFVVAPGPVAWEQRRKAVVHFLQKMNKTGPGFRIYPRHAPMLVKGFEGGYKFDEKYADKEPNKLRPIKNAYSHPHDALQYLCDGVKVLTTTLQRDIPRPYYSINSRARHGTQAINRR